LVGPGLTLFWRMVTMRAVLVWIIVALIVVLAGAAGTSALVLVGERKKRGLTAGGALAALPSGGGDHLLERTLRDLRVGDIVTFDGRDFLCEGVVSYDEDGHRWVGARLVDGSDVQWCVVGLERSGTMSVRLLMPDDAELSGYPPEALILGETRYALDKRGTATCKLDGDLGTLASRAGGKLTSTVERCRWWLYNGAGDDTAIVEQWGDDHRVLRGKKVPAGTIDLMPGS
jgi:Domain of unknown function (DUF4178)